MPILAKISAFPTMKQKLKLMTFNMPSVKYSLKFKKKIEERYINIFRENMYRTASSLE